MPEGGEIQAAPRGWHPNQRYLPARTRQARRILDSPRGADAIENFVCTPHYHGLAELGLVSLRAEHLGQFFVQLLRVHDLVRPEARGLLILPLMLGDADYAPCLRELLQGRDDEEPNTACPDHEGRLVRTGIHLERRVHRASQRLYRHSRFVWHIFRDPVELGRMGDESPYRPPPARIAAEAGLDAGGYVALRDVHA